MKFKFLKATINVWSHQTWSQQSADIVHMKCTKQLICRTRVPQSNCLVSTKQPFFRPSKLQLCQEKFDVRKFPANLDPWRISLFKMMQKFSSSSEDSSHQS